MLVDDASNQAAGYYGLPSYPYFVALDADGNVVARARVSSTRKRSPRSSTSSRS